MVQADPQLGLALAECMCHVGMSSWTIDRRGACGFFLVAAAKIQIHFILAPLKATVRSYGNGV